MSSVALVRSNRVVRVQAGRKADPQLLRLHLITFVLVLVAGELNLRELQRIPAAHGTP